MAYGFIERIGKKDEEVQDYLNENMYFEAWITAMRHTDLTAEDFYYKLEQEANCKSRKLDEEEIESIQIEWFDLTYQGEWDTRWE